jgi:hypothetical protein
MGLAFRGPDDYSDWSFYGQSATAFSLEVNGSLRPANAMRMSPTAYFKNRE